MKSSPYHGFLVLDKPPGRTSRWVVNQAQRWFPPRTRIGHTGTLDPLATGLLVLAVGQATRLVEYVQEMDKVYRTSTRLGADSDTDDADGQITPRPEIPLPTLEQIAAALAGFVGSIEQTPPRFSAAHVDGQRAHELARQGKTVELAPRVVQIYAVHLLAYHEAVLELEIHCGKGTYIRSIARDLGEKLGCGAYVHRLRRTRIGAFDVEHAQTLGMNPHEARSRLLPLEAALSELPRVTLLDEETRRFRSGLAVDRHGRTGETVVFDSKGGLLGIGKMDEVSLKPAKVLSQ